MISRVDCLGKECISGGGNQIYDLHMPTSSAKSFTLSQGILLDIFCAANTFISKFNFDISKGICRYVV